MKEKKLRSALPIYFVGLTWVLYALLFPLYTGRYILIAAFVSLAVYLVARPFFKAKVVQVEDKPKPVNTGNNEVDGIVNQGREALTRMRALGVQIKDEYIGLEISRMEKACGVIFDAVAQKPQKAPDIRKFMNYYLPTSMKLLETYQRLSSHQLQGTNINATLESVKSSMDMIATAFEKQADGMFEDEALDISTDIEVLETMMRSEGLKTPDDQ